MAGFGAGTLSDPAGRMAGFEESSTSDPAGGMAGFERPSRTYLPTVSRWIPSSRAMRRPDQPLATKVKIECCRPTFSWFIAWLCGLDRSQRNAHLTWLVLNLHSAPHWLVFTAR